MERCCFLVGLLLLVGCKSAVEKQLIEVARLNELQNKTMELIVHNKLQIEVEKVVLQKCKQPFFDEVSVIKNSVTTSSLPAYFVLAVLAN